MNIKNNRAEFILKKDQTSHMMGILNCTPDSFSDGGLYVLPQSALERSEELIREGAHSIDIGGMASGPGSNMLDVLTENERVLQVCRVLGENGVSERVPLSVDTFRMQVAKTAYEVCGVSVVNDISALRHDPEMAPFVAGEDLHVVLMYSKESAEYPLVTDREAPKGDLIETIKKFFDERVNFALKSNIKQKRIILDPGMGRFLGASPEHSWEMIKRIDEITRLFKDFPLLLGVSRKSFIGASVQERDIHSKLIELFLMNKGISIIRTHNVGLLHGLKKIWGNLHADF